ncbi:MAG: hypothetical protein M3371_07120 [Acidobacteriota bacterium]|nr:hypothetical protein [Acidobacteriota bacterium]
MDVRDRVMEPHHYHRSQYRTIVGEDHLNPLDPVLKSNEPEDAVGSLSIKPLDVP